MVLSLFTGYRNHNCNLLAGATFHLHFMLWPKNEENEQPSLGLLQLGTYEFLRTSFLMQFVMTSTEQL